ncbi:dienelactone hydrolase family protein [Chitinophaga rhizophila]|uniref:Dienelactone hydrolase family protein n=1 Tax=Chitinophaga rhizophila TaxID=2866212 RepID=A0ABS7GKW4_9BACT|nr:dienelactone hydrolase family protein [Chitinophaga rhizophila]MBW8688360.1 dienelactone hydrolase family protein [Chitinophaga rhizophila]
MKFNIVTMIAPAALAFCMAACNNQQASSEHATDTTVAQPTITEEALSIQADSVTLNSIVAFSTDTSAKKPIVLIVPEWWGLDDYVKGRARQLAELGYLAVGIDMYGNGKHADNPDAAKAYATPFYTNPQLGYTRLAAALAKAKTFPQADTTRIAAIGYCFGGSMVLNGAKLGLPVNGVVSFHGGLATVPPQKGLTKAQILVCHGGADPFVPAQDVTTFKKQLDSLSIPYTFKEYPGATHAFTNPAATATGKKFNMPIEYNAAADTASWNDMRTFFGEIFK